MIDIINPNPGLEQANNATQDLIHASYHTTRNKVPTSD
jgi:hypothetical protein